MMPSHPSKLELDRHAIADQRGDVAVHVRDCAECVAYVAELRAVVEVPAWARALPSRTPRLTSRSRPLIWAAALAAAVTLAVMQVPDAHETTDFRAKGLPSVSVYLKHNDQVELWDGAAKLHAGDQLRLRVSGEGKHWVSVVAANAILYSGAIDPVEPTLLPKGWIVDDTSDAEVLSFVFTDGAASELEVRDAALRQTRDDTFWTTNLTLTKEMTP